MGAKKGKKPQLGKGQKGGQNKSKKSAGNSRPIQFQAGGGSKSVARSSADQANKQGIVHKKVEVNLSISTEAALRSTISELSKDCRVPSERTKSSKTFKLKDEVRHIYLELSRLGFSNEQIEQALANIELDDISKDNAIDWLCLNFSADQLPRKLASGAFSYASEGTVTIVSKAKLDKKPVAAPSKSSLPVQQVERNHSLDTTNGTGNIATTSNRKKKEDADNTKDWIKKYMETAYEESSDEEMGIDPFMHQDSAGKWNVFADPREIQRRKNERPSSPREMEEQIRSELAMAHEEATRAKAEGDKQKQKEAGKLIRDLKEEMRELGIEEEKAKEGPKPEDAEGAESFADALFEESAKLKTEEESKGEGKSAEESSDDGELFGEDMFDEEKEDDYIPPSQPASHKKELSEEWLQDTPKKTKLKMKPQKPQQPAHEQLRMPKVLLQQHCQRNQLSNPKYDKIQSDDTTMYRYCVVVDAPNRSKGKANRKAKWEPTKFALEEEEDNWTSIQDAQNAVASKALFCITDQQPLHRIIPSPFRELWLKWEVDTEHVDEESRDKAEEERDKFVDALMNVLEKRGVNAGVSVVGNTAADKVDARVQEKSLGNKQDRFPRGPSNEVLRRELENRMEKKALASSLPINDIREQMVSSLQNNDFLIVCSETGSGKTTQVPQFVLDDSIMRGTSQHTYIICTQPRRIAAVSVAERVASERLESPPGGKNSRIGYHVRLDASASKDTKILFCTTGILLRKLIGNPMLQGVSHIVIDEVHERTVQSDLLLALARDIVHKRRASEAMSPLKLILMSATIDTSMLSEYLYECPVLSAGGRTFEVTQNYLEDIYEKVGYQLAPDNPASFKLRSENHNLTVQSQAKNALIRSGWGDDICSNEILNPNYQVGDYEGYSSTVRRNLMRLNEEKIDYELLQTLLTYIDENYDDGAVLVFLPGMAEINNLYDQVISSYHFGKSEDRKSWIIPLHSNISPEDQRRVFKKPPKGIRKIVLATNIAETSITIDDIIYVIDSGHVKERQYDASRGLGMLVEGWISAASAKQRKGRAGRVRPGVCFSLFTSSRAERMRKHPVPEIMRVPLEEVCLHIRKLQLGNCKEFLERLVQPPNQNAINAAVTALINIGAMNEAEDLTSLGHHLAGLPVDCRIGKLLLLGSILGCLSSMLTVAACLSYKSPFASSFEARDAADRAKAAMCLPGSKTIASGQFSDHLAMVAAYNGWYTARENKGYGAARAFAKAQHLSESTLYMIKDLRKQLATMLMDIGFISRKQDRRKANWIDDSEDRHNSFSNNPVFVKICLCSALYPNIAMMQKRIDIDATTWNDEHGDEVFIHPSSVNHGGSISISYPYPFMVYLDKVKTKKVYIHDTTVVSPYALLLFGGEIEILYEKGVVEVDKWIKLKVPAQTAVLFKRMRLIIDVHLRKKLNTQESDLSDQNDLLMSTVSRLFEDEDKFSNRGYK